MRKSYLACWSLLACAVIATLVIAIQTYATRDDVGLKETVIYGDSGKANGLTFDFVTEYHNKYYWHTKYTLGTPDLSQTKYGIYDYDSLPDEYKYQSEVYYWGLTNEKPNSFEEFPEDNFETEKDTWFEGKYYNLNAEFDLPTTHYIRQQYKDDLVYREELFLQNYFKIPRINIKGDHYDWDFTSTYSDDMCYFTFDLHTEKGNLADSSLFPDGFGIFAFPYEKGYIDEKGHHILGTDVSKLEKIFSLDPDTHIRALRVDHTQKRLLLFTAENDYLVLHIIDIATRTEIQRLELFKNRDFYPHIIDGAILVLNEESDELYVISSNPDQSYKIDFTFPWENEFFQIGNFMYFDCYDGERLVYSNYAGNATEPILFNPNDIFIAIYDKTGLSYIGTYRSSLLPAVYLDGLYSYSCHYVQLPKFSW